MKNITSLTSKILLLFIIISCGKETSDERKSDDNSNESKEIYNKDNKSIQDLKRESRIEARINDFSCVDNKSELCKIIEIKLMKGNIQCVDPENEKLCNEILKNLSELMIFNSDKEPSHVEDKEISKGYSMSNEGILSMDGNTYEANIYYNTVWEDSGSMTINGKLLVHGLPGMSYLEKELNPLLINIKGRK